MTTPEDTLARLKALAVVPVIVLDDPDDAPTLARALSDGGLPLAEVTLRTAAGLEAIAQLARSDDLLVGAGTVLNPAQVDAAVAAGARFIVSPGLSAAVVERCRQHRVLALPGAVTATEVMAGLELGLTALKFFPAAASGGMAAIRALAGPFPDLALVPTGGVTLENLAAYLALPQVAAVGGSWMVPRPLLRARARDQLQALVQEAVAAARQARPNAARHAPEVEPFTTEAETLDFVDRQARRLLDPP